METSLKLHSELTKRVPVFKAMASNNLKLGSSFWQYYQDSEQQLIQLMNTSTPPTEEAPGNIEFSWVLYYANYKLCNSPISFPCMDDDASAECIIQCILKSYLGMPYSQIDPDDWTTWDNEWNAEGRLMGDGSLVSYSRYAIMDSNWFVAFTDYIILLMSPLLKYIPVVKDLIVTKYPFQNTPATFTIDTTEHPQLNIALFSDWGTGAYPDGNLAASPSQLISQQIVKQSPDISIHLGDVYYCGTDEEETNNLLACWPAAKLANFTMNSNHEMYDGADSLFGITLKNSLFSKQNNTTYFKVEYGNWLIIGLDTAYYDPSTLFMAGAITDSAQTDFLRQAGTSGKKIMILTHHSPIYTDGSQKTSYQNANGQIEYLWNQVVSALGREPDYWYWGHVHNLIVYQNGVVGSIIGNVQCRCIGHGAIPIGMASWLENNSQVSRFADEPLDNPTVQQTNRVLNGYAMLTFTTNSVNEVYYDQIGNRAWTTKAHI